MPRRLRQPEAPYAESPVSPAGAYGHEAPVGGEVHPGLLRPRNGAGRAALVCGVLALICAVGFFLLITVPVAILLGLAAVVLGLLGRSRVRRGLATNRGSATTGIVTGLLALLLLAGLAVGGVALFNANKDNPTFKNIGACTKAAGTNSQKLQDCANQFKQDVAK
jgi:hypothetical protein